MTSVKIQLNIPSNKNMLTVALNPQLSFRKLYLFSV